MKYLLGYDIGSSSVKAALLEADTGKVAAAAFSPSAEMEIQSTQPGFAEQDPEQWWQELIRATAQLRQKLSFQPDEVIAIGISYQMHGLVCVDKDQQPLRPAIIWCDSRAAALGDKAFRELGELFCLSHFLNSPGNFTASKLRWVKEMEPDIFEKIHQVLLPGDFIAMKLTGIAATTVSGLSEGILWDYQDQDVARTLLDYYQIPPGMLAPRVPVFGEQGRLSRPAATALGLSSGIPVSYRAGDQPNNAYSLNVCQPGEVAATAGTSGVVYGITDKASYDPLSRVNPFVHVNHQKELPRYGVLLCVNGTGRLNSWLRKNVFTGLSYDEMNERASRVGIGADGLLCYPFGNGAERILMNKDSGASYLGLQLNRHDAAHLVRAAQEGIVFALNYGMEIMKEMDIPLHTIRAGYANMFLSDVFAQTFANASGCTIELYNTDGATGAARAAGVGSGFYSGIAESFTGMERLRLVEPHPSEQPRTQGIYQQWKTHLLSITS